MVVLEPLPDCGKELDRMIDNATDREAVSLAKLFTTPHGESQIFERGKARVRAWLKAYGTLQ